MIKTFSAAVGSSPRARGTARGGVDPRRRRRFIPARAGNGRRTTRPPGPTSVHPRARGERRSSPSCPTTCAGSSPRARGTAICSAFIAQAGRFIPARAGNGTEERLSRSQSSVHPRARGERLLTAKFIVSPTGSSPRARGTVVRAASAQRRARFIPARAGNGPLQARRAPCPSVHPRARGERLANVLGSALSFGSSPRARGTVTNERRVDGSPRFIPARAGNGGFSTATGSRYSVHPRARGERRSLTPSPRAISGSSPRARGTARRYFPEHGVVRFIPARAGNGGACDPSRAPTTVHPRARGERVPPRKRRYSSTGSSPRARGTARGMEHAPAFHRFIPARAGNGFSVA